MSSARAVAPRPPVVEHIVRNGTRLTLAFAALQTVAHLVNAATAEVSLLDVNEEQSLSSWASVSATSAAALACLLLAATGTARASFLLLAPLLAVLSLDDAVALHERLGERTAGLAGLSGTWDSVLWPALLLPIMAAALILLVSVARTAPALLARRIGVGLAALALAVLLEVASAPLSPPGSRSTGHTLEGAVEEALELVGWGLVATCLVAWFAWALQAGREGATERPASRA